MIWLALLLAAAAPLAPAIPPNGRVAGAKLWDLDQLRILRETDPAKVDQLAPVHSLAEAMTVLKTLRVPYVHVRASLDPAKLPAPIRAQIVALPKGEPFVLRDGAFISINVIVEPNAFGGAAFRPIPSFTSAHKA